MRQLESAGLRRWAWRWQRYPDKYPPLTKTQTLALQIDHLLIDGQWHTIRAIALNLKAKFPQVRDALFCIKDVWNYEAIRSVHRGYRKKI